MVLKEVQWERENLDPDGKEAPCFTCCRPLSESMPSWEWYWDYDGQFVEFRRGVALAALPDDLRICNKCKLENTRRGSSFLVWAARKHKRCVEDQARR